MRFLFESGLVRSRYGAHKAQHGQRIDFQIHLSLDQAFHGIIESPHTFFGVRTVVDNPTVQTVTCFIPILRPSGNCRERRSDGKHECLERRYSDRKNVGIRSSCGLHSSWEKKVPWDDHQKGPPGWAPLSDASCPGKMLFDLACIFESGDVIVTNHAGEPLF